MAKIYKCDYMDSGINFERWKVYVCCKTAHEGGGMPILAESYEEFNWDKIFELKQKWKKQIEQGNPPDKCKGCPSIVETDEVTDDLSINFVDVNSFVNCNSRCCYCDCWSVKDFEETSLLPRFQELFNKNLLKDSSHGYIQFAGGEPALMKDFEKIITLCIKNDLQHFIVNSNGIKYSLGIEQLLKQTNANLIVSLDSGSVDTYKKIKNVDCFEKVCKNLSKYCLSQVVGKSLVWSKFIIIPGINDNMNEIQKWYNLSLELGIKAIILDVEREWFIKNDRQITKNMCEMIEFIQNKCKEDEIQLNYYEQLKCLYGIH